MKTTKPTFSLKEIYAKMEYYCAYQERCYKEVEEKLYSFSVNLSEKEEILTYLIENNFINEERTMWQLMHKPPIKPIFSELMI